MSQLFAHGGQGAHLRFFFILPEALPGRMKWRDTNNCRPRLE
jgi:hypothetical protein